MRDEWFKNLGYSDCGSTKDPTNVSALFRKHILLLQSIQQHNSTTLALSLETTFLCSKKKKKKVKLLLTFENDTHLVAFILYHIHSFFFKCTEAHNMNIAVLN